MRMPPSKTVPFFSNYCVFVWTSKNDLKPQRVNADVLETGEKKPPFSDKNGYVWTGPKLNRKNSRFYILHFLGAEVRE